MTNDSATLARPAVPTGQELYDQIMHHIEPELTSQGLLTLQDKYKGETPEQFAERKKRYVTAFQRYDQAYQGYLATLHSQVEHYRRASVEKVEANDRTNDGTILDSISQAWL